MDMELSDIPEPVMAQFDRLPLSMQMRVTADVLRRVNQRCMSTGRGDLAFENWWPTKLHEVAATFDHEDYAQRLKLEAVSARARGDEEAERSALDQLALFERQYLT